MARQKQRMHGRPTRLEPIRFDWQDIEEPKVALGAVMAVAVVEDEFELLFRLAA